MLKFERKLLVPAGNAAKAREDAEYALELLEEHRQNVKEIEPVRSAALP